MNKTDGDFPYRTIDDIDLFVGGSLEQVLMAIMIHVQNFQPHHKALMMKGHLIL